MAKSSNTPAEDAAPATKEPQVVSPAVVETGHIMRPQGEPRPMPSDFAISLGVKGQHRPATLKPGHRTPPRSCVASKIPMLISSTILSA